MKKLKTLYECLDEFTEEEVNDYINKLNQDLRDAYKKRYGEDYKHPSVESMSREDRQKLNGHLSYMRKRLKQQHKKKQQSENLEQNTQPKQTLQPQNIQQQNTEIKKKKVKVKKLEVSETTETLREQKMKINRIKSHLLESQIKSLPWKEQMVATCYVGYIDDLFYSPEYIADFYNIDKENVLKIIDGVLTTYKEDTNKKCEEIKTMLKKRK